MDGLTVMYAALGGFNFRAGLDRLEDGNAAGWLWVVAGLIGVLVAVVDWWKERT